MIKGYFVHKSPDAIPSSFGFAYVLGMIGIARDPTFDANWDKVKHIRRGIYQRPIVTSYDDAFKHSAFLIELCQYNNPGWNDMPLLLNILQPNVDLTFINVWVEQITNALHPKEKPLLFTTPAHWEAIQKGPNAEVVSKTILQKADLFSSEYRAASPSGDKGFLPSKVLYVEKLKYWEFENGKMQYAPDGVFTPSAVEPPAVITDPPSGPTEAPHMYIHIKCPHCGNTVF